MELRGSQTEQNLKAAFAGESMANRRYNYFARQADIEGHTDVANVFRAAADGETGHAFGHMDYLENDPATDREFGTTELNLVSAIAGETHEFTVMYPEMADKAREEGFEEIAEWFQILAQAEALHNGKFQQALMNLRGE